MCNDALPKELDHLDGADVKGREHGDDCDSGPTGVRRPNQVDRDDQVRHQVGERDDFKQPFGDLHQCFSFDILFHCKLVFTTLMIGYLVDGSYLTYMLSNCLFLLYLVILAGKAQHGATSAEHNFAVSTLAEYLRVVELDQTLRTLDACFARLQ